MSYYMPGKSKKNNQSYNPKKPSGNTVNMKMGQKELMAKSDAGIPRESRKWNARSPQPGIKRLVK